ncbi:hypothetical protein [Bifidobacterium longum]|uniref:hypothetical protein n=1 Tax=Bifidobacterium longum TaxID=216816 RepID=UPI001F599417|nr:hypothetical protein [Bifidobacterium longum]
MALPIQVNPKDPCIDIHTGRGQGSCTFANGFNCVCSCAGIAHAQLLRMVLTPENSKKLPNKYKQALANKVQTVQARIADIPHDKVTTIIHAQKQPKRVFFLCEDVSHPIIDYCRVIDILRWARENPLASQQVSKLCTCVQNHGINSFKEAFRCLVWVGLSGGDGAEVEFAAGWPSYNQNKPTRNQPLHLQVESGELRVSQSLCYNGHEENDVIVTVSGPKISVANETPTLMSQARVKCRGQHRCPCKT